jgi:hypothetical protein
MMLSVSFSAGLVRIAAKTIVGSGLLGPQAAPPSGLIWPSTSLQPLDPAMMQASVARLLALRLSLDPMRLRRVGLQKIRACPTKVMSKSYSAF